MTDIIQTTREELRSRGLLPSPTEDACTPADVDDRADAALFLNDELQRSLQALAERCAGQYRMRVEADRARWKAEDRIRRLVNTLEWFTRYLPMDPKDDNPEDRIAREVIHYAVTGVELTFPSPEYDVPAPEEAPDVPPPVAPRASVSFDGTSTAEAVYQALGAVSVAWDPRPVGVFDSSWAKSVGDALLEHIGLGYEVHGQLVDGEGSDRD